MKQAHCKAFFAHVVDGLHTGPLALSVFSNLYLGAGPPKSI